MPSYRPAKPVEQLIRSGLDVIDSAFRAVPARDRQRARMFPLFSGGHDSYSACSVACRHPEFRGTVYHIDTGTGAKATRDYIDQVCSDEGWRLEVLRSPVSYEDLVGAYGFPGPGMHRVAYDRLKDRAVRLITRHPFAGQWTSVLVTGCRSQESVRRMGHVEPVKIGEKMKDGSIREPHRVWTAPCHDWSGEDQVRFMDYHNLDRNPVKQSVLGMSGECFCGAFARPGELEMIERVCPDVKVKIERAAGAAKAAGKPCEWGVRPKGRITVAETGPMCSGCDLKAAANGVKIVPRK